MPLTDQQRHFVGHIPGAFVEACPGAGKTRTIIERIARIASTMPPCRGLAVLSFTNAAIEEFMDRCHASGLDGVLRHPGFIGTFDAFIRQFFFSPRGIDDIPIRPTIVDSWESLGVDIRLRGADAFHGDGVSLDLFDAATNQINPTSIGHTGLRAHVQRNQIAYQQAAAQRRQGLRRSGYLSAADVRADIIRRFEDANWSAALGRALAARFQEIIVDEAQDCNPFDCRIIRWLRGKGVSVTIVADPDQSIYEFRHGNPTELRALADNYDTLDRLEFTGSFRCSPSICNVAATLRTRAVPDTSLGETRMVQEPVFIITYQGNSVQASIGREFCELMGTYGIPVKDGIILAHSRKNALRACGSGAEEEVENSHVASIARAVGLFWSTLTSSHERESALRTVERAILDLMGMIDQSEVPSRAAERRGLDPRWLRRSALQLISQLPRTCEDTNEARTIWIIALREAVLNLHLTYREGTSERQYFRNRANTNWNRLLGVGTAPEIRSSTIHEAKGKEYEAVCIVIPPDRGASHRTDQLLTCWENRTDDEAKRVIYVGITRAKRLATLAIPVTFRDRLVAILETGQTNFQVQDI